MAAKRTNDSIGHMRKNSIDATSNHSSQLQQKFPGANVASQMSLDAPEVSMYLIAQQTRLNREFGAMLPAKYVQHTPNTKVLSFLK